MNPRDGFPPYSLSRGAPSATWVLLHAKYRIHLEKMWRREWDSNPRMLPHRRFSRPVPSTTRTSLHVRSPAKCKKDDTTLFAHCQLPPAIFFCFFSKLSLDLERSPGDKIEQTAGASPPEGADDLIHACCCPRLSCNASWW